jgi:hypothetical protein
MGRPVRKDRAAIFFAAGLDPPVVDRLRHGAGAFSGATFEEIESKK